MGNLKANPIHPPASTSPDPLGIIDHFVSIYEQAGTPNHELHSTIRSNIVFISMGFDRRILKGSISDPATYLKEFNRVYRNLMRVAYGRHYYRKHDHLPLTYVCADYEGSRHVCTAGNVVYLPEAGMRGVYDQTRRVGNHRPYIKGELMHLHAMMLLKPGYGQAGREVIMDYAAAAGRSQSTLVDMQFPRPDRSLVELASYCSKGVAEIARVTGAEAWMVLPR